MNSYQQIQQFIKQLDIPSSGRYRCDCPSCGNKNTFSLVQDGLEVKYNCFHINCNTKGVMQNGLSIDVCRNTSFNNNNVIPRSDGRLEYDKRELGRLFIRPSNACFSYLCSYNINTGNYSTYFNSLKYDPKQNRLVFPLEYKGDNYGYVGRALDRRITPKWYVYVRLMGCPYIPLRVPDDNKYAVLVEDCISALRSVAYFNSIALLGTTVNAETIPYLLDYDRLYVALDPDATLKALTLQKKLLYYKDTRVLPIKNDLKYYSDNDLRNLKEKIDNDQ